MLIREIILSLSREIARSAVRESLAVVAWSPTVLFAASEKGAIIDPSDLSTVFSDSAGTTPAVVDGPVGYIADKSGNGKHFTQATTSLKPTLRSSGGLYFLEFDGVDDNMATAAIDFTATDKMVNVCGAYKASDAAQGLVLSLGAQSAFGSWEVLLNGSALPRWSFSQRGDHATGTCEYRASTYTAPITNVLYCAYDISGALRANEVFPRINGVIPTLATAGQTSMGAGNFGNWSLYIGRRPSNFSPFNGRLYAACVIGRTVTSDERGLLESWAATKSGVTL